MKRTRARKIPKTSLAIAAGVVLVTMTVPTWCDGPGAGDAAREESPVKPPALRKGDTIALIAPAGPVDKRKVREAVRNIQRRGYRVRVMPRVNEVQGYLAGSDADRAADLNQAFKDPTVKMVHCLRGGYGSPRLLDLIDYDVIRRNPKIFVGFSDISALLVALSQKANLITFHGPMAMTDHSGKRGLAPFAARHFWPLIEASTERRADFADWGATAPRGLGIRRALAPGVAEGTLVGGNLSTVVSLVGTPYAVDTREKIFFIEDVNEEPFRIDRMLCQLHLAGTLRQCRGILVGAFTQCVAKNKKQSLTVDEVLMQYLGGLNIPVLAGFPAGHLPVQATLPIGSRVRLDANAKTLSILELPVSVQPEDRTAL